MTLPSSIAFLTFWSLSVVFSRVFYSFVCKYLYEYKRTSLFGAGKPYVHLSYLLILTFLPMVIAIFNFFILFSYNREDTVCTSQKTEHKQIIVCSCL